MPPPGQRAQKALQPVGKEPTRFALPFPFAGCQDPGKRDDTRDSPGAGRVAAGLSPNEPVRSPRVWLWEGWMDLALLEP